jgi:HK97 family phage portal protein
MGIMDFFRRWRGGGQAVARLTMQERAAELLRIRSEGMAMLIKSMRSQEQLLPSLLGKPKWTDYNERTVIDNGLKASVVVYACTTLVARTASSVPWYVYVDGELAPEHPLQLLIDSPNQDWTWTQLIQHTMYSLQLWGEAFLPKVRSLALGRSELYPTRTGADAGLPAEIWLLRPDGVAVVRGTDSLIARYQDKVSKKTIAVEDMLHASYVNPGDLYRGLSPLEPAQKDVDIDVAAASWQKSSFSNRAVPDGYFKPKEILDEEQFDELLLELQGQFGGVDNARKFLLLGMDLDWVELSKTMVEMDFMNGRAYTAQNICTAFGVPPEMVGLREAKYANYATAERVLWQQTILPNIYALRDIFNARLAPEYGETVTMLPDLSGVDALLRVFGERWEIAEKMLKAGLPYSLVNEEMGLSLPEFAGQRFTEHTLKVIETLGARGVPMATLNTLLDLGIPPFPGWEVGLVPANLVPLDLVVGGGITDGE